MKKAFIFNIQRFSVHDGPGIRTVVFFKGCNLRCSWCHNPESIKSSGEIEFYPDRCIGCGSCFDLCKNKVHSLDERNAHQIDRAFCEGCFDCVEACFADALVGVGREINSQKILENILTDREYNLNSRGGVTFSGGECMLQIDVLEDLLKKCKEEGVHTAIDTAANVPWSYFERVLPYTDLFLIDIKSADGDVHKQHTGVGNSLIFENIRKLSDSEKELVLRIPLIPGVNDRQIVRIGEFLMSLHISRVEVLPYHKLGEHKYEALGYKNRVAAFKAPTKEQMEKAVRQLRDCGVNAK